MRQLRCHKAIVSGEANKQSRRIYKYEPKDRQRTPHILSDCYDTGMDTHILVTVGMIAIAHHPRVPRSDQERELSSGKAPTAATATPASRQRRRLDAHRGVL